MTKTKETKGSLERIAYAKKYASNPANIAVRETVLEFTDRTGAEEVGMVIEFIPVKKSPRAPEGIVYLVALEEEETYEVTPGMVTLVR